MKTDSFSTKATLLLVSSLTIMSGATIAPALPAMQLYFSDVEYAGFWIRLVLTLPALFIVLAGPLTGFFVDRKGRLYLLIPAMILYGITGSSGLYLDSIAGILAGRALLGIAVAGIMTSATTLIADYYEGAARSKFMGWQAAFMSFGGVIFLTVGGGLAEIGWRWPFLIYLFSILLIPLVLFSLTEPSGEGSGLKPEKETDNLNVKPAKLLGFIYGTVFFGMIIFYCIPLQIPYYIEQYFDAGPTVSGIAIGVSTLFAIITSLSYGRVRAKLGHIPILGLSFALMGTGFLLIGIAENFLLVLTGLAVSGLGMGFIFPNLNVWLTTEVPAAIRGRAVGGMTTAIFLGQFISPLAGQPVVEIFGLKFLFWSAGTVLLLTSLVFVSRHRAILSFTAPEIQNIPEVTLSDSKEKFSEQVPHEIQK